MKKLLLTASLLLLAGCSSAPAAPTGPITPRADSPSMGNPSAKVVIEEFGDFQCPACKGAAEIADEIVKKFSGEVKFVWRQYPLEQIHDGAMPAALASECANEQGKFWEYHDVLYANQKSFTSDDLKSAAQSVGLDMAKFTECFDSKKYKDAVRQDQALGNSRNIGGTPTFFVNGDLLPSWKPDVFESFVQQKIQENR